jgi:homoserine kinase
VIRVKAPASIANLGPGFDCAAVAVDLWNELEVRDGAGVEIVGEDAETLPRDGSHLALRAFSLLAPTDGLRFSFTNRIPIGRGLGSSAAAVALGLVAGAIAAGRRPDAEELLQLGSPLEGHADNLAACLAGGVCFTWSAAGRQWLTRVASELPLVPLAVVPDDRVDTAGARSALPPSVPHADAAFSSARAALLGAALASGDARLLASAFEDRVHEPYRAEAAPLLGRLRAETPAGAVGVTLAGSGPTVIVWARPDDAEHCRSTLETMLGGHVVPLAVAPAGAQPSVMAGGERFAASFPPGVGKDPVTDVGADGRGARATR